MLPPPFPATNPLRLGDWLELYAIISADGNSSAGDLERLLHSGAVLELEEEDRRAAFDHLAPDVFAELSHRTEAANIAYPFEVAGTQVRLRVDFRQCLPYVFCLCLSYLKFQQQRGQKLFPRRLFEKLSTLAAKQYLNGEAVRFGSPRDQTELPGSFRTAVNRLCELIGEGNACVTTATFSSQDDRLDVVGWKNCPDALPGKLLLFGQCASGSDWEGKLTELNAEAWFENWMTEAKVSKIIKAFFIPHRLDRQQWKHLCRNGGMIFDRCRIAYWAQTQDGLPNADQFLQWTTDTLNGVRN